MSQGTSEPGDATAQRPLDVEIAVEYGCPLSGRDLEAVRQSVTRSDVGEPDTCQVAIPADGSGYERRTIDGPCPCAILDEHECIADLDAVRDGRLHYSVVVPRRSVLRSIVADLRAIGASVSVERIRTGACDDPPSTDVSLTDKQREALALAIEAGYYEEPRGATLEDLADELDVTPSAVSQRLNAVERKLVAERARTFDLTQSGAAD